MFNLKPLCLLIFSPLCFSNDNCVFNINQGQVNRLNKSCTYNGTAVISQSGTVLDCNGAVIDGNGENNIGVAVIGKGISNVLIKNCIIRNEKSTAIRVSSGVPQNIDENNHSLKYSYSPKKILIENTTTENSGGVNIYIDNYVTDSAIINSKIINSKGVGVYLDYSTSHILVKGNSFIGNGLNHQGRELPALAIDSSSNNKIIDNVFSQNAAGSMFLYKNCGEHYSSGKSAVRWQGSNKNLISGNDFNDEKVGVWIAARQSKDLSSWGCADKSMDQNGKYFEDFADYNYIISNKFKSVLKGVVIEGDNNKVINNDFIDSSGNDIVLPRTKKYEYLGLKQSGNDIVK
ncbi:right-handed parallel beta-helix repeat-containing protein [Pantoea sp. A4]|uniref:right-handed parallel beta-helix repeat-containing protein n=1 Tax=Pantoea sp. A4 TaxID=1225184 RepID=UPI00037B7AF8|nr:right-handed parallel beta-helix repeat-containing protein [Pantoea sp. A4]